MVSRENRVLLASTGTVLLVLVVVAVTDVGIGGALAAFVFAGLGVLVTVVLLWEQWRTATGCHETARRGRERRAAGRPRHLRVWAGYQSAAV